MLEMDLQFRHCAESHTGLNPFFFFSFFPKWKTYPTTSAISLFHIFQNSPEGAHTNKSSPNAGGHVNWCFFGKARVYCVSPFSRILADVKLQSPVFTFPMNPLVPSTREGKEMLSGESKPHDVSFLLVRKKGACSKSKGVSAICVCWH